MKRWILAALLLAIPVLAAYLAATTLPYVAYDRLLHGRWKPGLYQLSRWDPLFLAPGKAVEEAPPGDDFSGLWKEFHLRDVVVPLPAGHPLFQTIPLIQQVPGKSAPELGVLFRSPRGREMARLYLLRNGVWNDHFESQLLFKLPLVRRVLQAKAPEEVWRDVFSRPLKSGELPWQEMAYNLYLLQLRSSLLPPAVIGYRLLPDGKRAVVEVRSKNRDYRTELVMQFEGGLLLSYLLVSERQNPDSQELRARCLSTISFRPSDPSLTPIVYREFKHLPFNRQTDQEGMLYLFSAWSHDIDNQDMLREMVYFLERGEKSGAQLRPLYRYALTRYGKTFTTRAVGLDEDDEDVRLQRLIELEGREERRKLQETAARPVAPPEKPTTPRERMDEYLRKARQDRASKPRPKGDKLIIY